MNYILQNFLSILINNTISSKILNAKQLVILVNKVSFLQWYVSTYQTKLCNIQNKLFLYAAVSAHYKLPSARAYSI